MCYSEKQSLNFFIINVITCVILYNTQPNANKILALFFLFVGFMQLFDFILWRNQNIQNIDQENINYITTKIAMIFNHLQPIIFALIIYIYKGSLGYFSRLIIYLYIIFAIVYTLYAFNNIKYTLVNNINVTNESFDRRSLKWDWNNQPYRISFYTLFLFSLFILSYENFRFPLNILLSFINFFTYLFSLYYFKNEFVGRFWCKFAAWVPFVFLIIN